jgi:hypothetical protein
MDNSKWEKIILDDDAEHKKSSPEILDIDLIQSGAERKAASLGHGRGSRSATLAV